MFVFNFFSFNCLGLVLVGGVGAVEGLELDLDEHGLLESEHYVCVHARAEVLDGRGVVEGLALLVRTTESVVEAVQLL